MKNRLRRALAELAVLTYLLTVAPVYAMSEIERREIHEPAIVQMVRARERRRALDRRYGVQRVQYRFIY